MTEPRDKQMPRRGRGRTTGGSSSATGRDVVRDRGRRDQMIQDEENLERDGHSRSTCVWYSYNIYLLICDYHTCSRLRNFSNLSFRSLILNYDSKLSAGAAVPLFCPGSATVR